MMDRWVRRWEKLLFVAGLWVAWTTVGWSQATAPSFEVASVRMRTEGNGGFSVSPSGAARFTATNVSINFLIAVAYNVDVNQLIGAPKRGDEQLYSVDAKPEGDVGLTYEQLEPLLQNLLAQRFALSVHHEKKDVKGYAMVVAKGGAKLEASKAPSSSMGYIFANGLRVPSTSIHDFTAMLAHPVGRPVVDKTGITGSYSINLKFAPEGAADSELPSIFTALEEQLGLKLQPASVPRDFLVIDHVEKVPTEN